MRAMPEVLYRSSDRAAADSRLCRQIRSLLPRLQSASLYAGVSDFFGELKARIEVAKQHANGDPHALPREVIAAINTDRLLGSLTGDWVAVVG